MVAMVYAKVYVMYTTNSRGNVVVEMEISRKSRWWIASDRGSNHNLDLPIQCVIMRIMIFVLATIRLVWLVYGV